MGQILAVNHRTLTWAVAVVVVIAAVVAGVMIKMNSGTTTAQVQAPAASRVPGQSSLICNQGARYLTSPWSYHGLASGSQSYTVAQYKALSGYGKTLPPLPSHIASQSPATTAAVIFAPGGNASQPAFNFPDTPILYFFEGGAYGELSLQSVSGDMFIGGSAPGFPEPTFNNHNQPGGISAQNNSFGFSGGASILAAKASGGAKVVTTTTAIDGYISYLTFADGSTYHIASHTKNSITLDSPLTAAQAAGSPVWANIQAPITKVASSARQGAGSVTLADSSIPLVPYGEIRVGDHQYQSTSVSGRQSGYTVGVAGLDMAVAANTPVYYGDLSGGVTVLYLDISHDLHNTTGTIYTGSGWTVSHNNIHDGYSTPGNGIAIYGGDQGVIEYNCLAKMGTYGVSIFGVNNKFRHNEIFESNYLRDPGCGCSGGGKWWGTVNADIVDNAFVNDSPGGGSPVWLDNGNTGTLISGNYFDKSYGSAVVSETGFNLNITGNLFMNGGWGNGTGACGANCNGAVNLNSSGGFHIPGSRYDNQVLVTKNQFISNWMGVNIWQAGGRSCENSGEGWPDDSGYCTGGYPTTQTAAARGQYFFSHIGDAAHGFTTSVVQNAPAGSSTVLVKGAVAINDQIGFTNPVKTTTSETTNVSALTGSATIRVASTAGFPSSGQLRVGTSAAWSDAGGSFTGAILSYAGKTATTFTRVSLVRGTGTLAGPILQVQPYKVTAETCYANDCALTIKPALATPQAAGDTVTNAGTCQLYATSAALPSGPLAPIGVSYWNGCQWRAQHISVTGNTFVFDPGAIAAGHPLVGRSSTSCTADHANACGTNFMAFQLSGEPPFSSQIGANALMSNAALKNINTAANPPGAPAGNGAAPADNVWADNTYSGPWRWNAYIFGDCARAPMPTDQATGKSLPADACSVDFAHWRSYWKQDVGSTSQSAG